MQGMGKLNCVELKLNCLQELDIWIGHNCRACTIVCELVYGFEGNPELLLE